MPNRVLAIVSLPGLTSCYENVASTLKPRSVVYRNQIAGATPPQLGRIGEIAVDRLISDALQKRLRFNASAKRR
jgi:hypothetical protein